MKALNDKLSVILTGMKDEYDEIQEEPLKRIRDFKTRELEKQYNELKDAYGKETIETMYKYIVALKGTGCDLIDYRELLYNMVEEHEIAAYSYNNTHNSNDLKRYNKIQADMNLVKQLITEEIYDWIVHDVTMEFNELIDKVMSTVDLIKRFIDSEDDDLEIRKANMDLHSLYEEYEHIWPLVLARYKSMKKQVKGEGKVQTKKTLMSAIKKKNEELKQQQDEQDKKVVKMDDIYTPEQLQAISPMRQGPVIKVKDNIVRTVLREDVPKDVTKPFWISKIIASVPASMFN